MIMGLDDPNSCSWGLVFTSPVFVEFVIEMVIGMSVFASTALPELSLSNATTYAIEEAKSLIFNGYTYAWMVGVVDAATVIVALAEVIDGADASMLADPGWLTSNSPIA